MSTKYTDLILTHSLIKCVNDLVVYYNYCRILHIITQPQFLTMYTPARYNMGN